MPLARHINFFELEKACAQHGCPLCTLVSARTRQYLDNMLFEHVSDRAFRAAHRQSGGFCSFHAKNLETFRDGLAVAILGRDILEERIESFKKRKAWKPKGVCPVCAEQNRLEQEYLSFLAETETQSSSRHEDEQTIGDLKTIFTASEGLCAPHYARFLETTKRPPLWLIEFHEGKFNALLKRINQFIELSAYGHQAEFAALSDRDKIVWQELALNLRGSAD
ncbi:MAG: DUF6062 family protein [Spirochaetaceae bacterium]|jgi:hypothetical protein|nr:DUF6062 family protein [Spirochaetaceae bacterium]